MVWRAAIKTAYDGRLFAGSQRQPGLRTVEGEVIRTLKSINAITDEKTSRFRAASRTDRGVSALGNVFAFDTEFRANELLKAMNSVAGDLYFYAIAKAPLDFSPRRAKRRWYKYLVPKFDCDIDLMRKCASLFEGRHDFKQFCRRDGRKTLRTIDKIVIEDYGGYLSIDFFARDFLWNMVRKIVSAMISVSLGKSSIADLEDALAGKAIDFGMAPAENLVLMDVEYDIGFEIQCTMPFLKNFARKRNEIEVQSFFFDHLKSVSCVNAQTLQSIMFGLISSERHT